MMKQGFSPVSSRRLGQSLSIDPIPLKTCSWNCIYCQLGWTRPVVNSRRNFFEKEVTLSQVREALDKYALGEIDWISFVGSGETILQSGLGGMVYSIELFTDIPVVLITNGSSLFVPGECKEILAADLLYRRINRPHPCLIFECLIDGLMTFQKEYQKNFWIEIMLLKDMNDDGKSLHELADYLEKIKPDEVLILQPIRSPAEAWVKSPDEEGFLCA